MYILVKNLNGRLIFIMDNEVDFEVLLSELKGLLVQSFFKKKDYYPKAFFDLKGRILENDEILQFFGVLVECKSLLFGGEKRIKNDRCFYTCGRKNRNL